MKKIKVRCELYNSRNLYKRKDRRTAQSTNQSIDHTLVCWYLNRLIFEEQMYSCLTELLKLQIRWCRQKVQPPTPVATNRPWGSSMQRSGCPPGPCAGTDPPGINSETRRHPVPGTQPLRTVSLPKVGPTNLSKSKTQKAVAGERKAFPWVENIGSLNIPGVVALCKWNSSSLCATITLWTLLRIPTISRNNRNNHNIMMKSYNCDATRIRWSAADESKK